MKITMRTVFFALLAGLALLLTACGGGGGGSGTTSGGGAAATTIEISSDGENLAYDKTTLTVTSGAQVTIKFNNTSAVQQHNWVLVKGGEDVATKIATDGLAAGAGTGYLPADQSNIIAHSALLNGGESGEVVFTAPAPGTYLYICTVPGHYPLMQGTLTVQ